MLQHFELDPTVTFLNHGSFGACPRAVLEHQSELRRMLERRPIEFMARELAGRLAEARTELARFVGADPDDLAFVPNATTGVNSVLRSFALTAGDEILVTSHGYNACSNAARFVAERAGAHVRVIDLPVPIESNESVVAAVMQQVTANTRLLLIDHVTSPTGIVLPVAAIAAQLRERGIETLVDGAHAPGMLPLDLESLGVGYYTGNCHKWMCAPKGSGFLFVRKDLQDSVRPAVISHGANAPLVDQSRFRVEFDWIGTSDPTPYLSVPKAIECMAQLVPGGWDAIRQRNHELAVNARQALLAATDSPPIAPPEMLGSLASVTLPPAERAGAVSAWDVDPLQAELYERDKIEVPIMVWPALPQRLLRVSAAIYNTESDYERLATALKARLVQKSSH